MIDRLWKFHRVDGKTKFYEQEKLAEFLRTIENGEAIFRKERKGRTLNQNDYYWAVVVELIAKDSGNDGDDVHEFLKDKFLPKRVRKFYNEEKMISTSSTKLTTAEFEEYLDKIRAWAMTEQNINIPLPNEVNL